MQPRFLNPGSSSTTGRGLKPGAAPSRPYGLLRFPTALPGGISGLPSRNTSNSLAILEAVDRLASLSMDSNPQDGRSGMDVPSLIRGFKATVPSSELPKQRRRMIRGGLVDADLGYEKIGLKKLGDRARGLLTERGEEIDEEGLGVGRKSRKRRRNRMSEGRHLTSMLHLEDLLKQADEIAQDKENLHVRTVRDVSPAVHLAD
jgi:division protein 1